ncbi:MAG: NAD(P)/FAD-dependent oxidoreductase [Methylophilaceae bacterium]
MKLAHTLPSSLYEASLIAPRANYPSFIGSLDCDVCIIGGGYTGLHTALNLQEQGLKVIILEAQYIGYGASGRNGGHVIPEFGGSQSNFEKQLDMESAKKVWEISHGAADNLRERISKYSIDCDYQSGHIEAAITPRHASALRDWQAHIEKNYGYKNAWISQNEMPQFIGTKRYLCAALDKNGGHVHPLKLALGLAQAFKANGGEIFEKSPASTWSLDAGNVHVSTANGEIKCKHLVLACNVDMESIQTNSSQKLAKRILPVGSWVIATESLSQSLAGEILPSRAAVVDMRFILDYYRLSADNRLVFGAGVKYLSKQIPDEFFVTVRKKMLKIFPQLVDTKIEYSWSGLIDITMNRMPDFGYAGSDQVLYAQGFSGSGVVATNAAAKVISEAILGDTKNLAMFQRIQHTPFPGGKMLRGPITAAGMLYHRLLDLI